ATEILLTGDPIDADTAARWGLVNAVVPQSEVLPHALGLAGRIASNAPLAVQATKRIAAGIEDDRVAGEDVGWRITGTEMARVLASADAAEGPRAFAEKRLPRWAGRRDGPPSAAPGRPASAVADALRRIRALHPAAALPDVRILGERAAAGG